MQLVQPVQPDPQELPVLLTVLLEWTGADGSDGATGSGWG